MDARTSPMKSRRVQSSADQISVHDAFNSMVKGQAVKVASDGRTYFKYNQMTHIIECYSESDLEATKLLESIEISEFIRKHTATKFTVFKTPMTKFLVYQPCVCRPNGTYVLNSRVHKSLDDVRKVNHVVGYRIFEITPFNSDG